MSRLTLVGNVVQLISLCSVLVALLVLNVGNEQALVEWEYIPPVGPRPVKGFVGLKNAGATCYMNSVTQQVPIICSYLTVLLFFMKHICNTVCLCVGMVVSADYNVIL